MSNKTSTKLPRQIIRDAQAGELIFGNPENAYSVWTFSRL
jgi:hypothetical protein